MDASSENGIGSSEDGAESSENGTGSPLVAVAGFTDENQSWLKPAKKSAKVVTKKTKKTKKGKPPGKHSSNNRVSHSSKCERMYTHMYMYC